MLISGPEVPGNVRRVSAGCLAVAQDDIGAGMTYYVSDGGSMRQKT